MLPLWLSCKSADDGSVGCPNYDFDASRPAGFASPFLPCAANFVVDVEHSFWKSRHFRFSARNGVWLSVIRRRNLMSPVISELLQME